MLFLTDFASNRIYDVGTVARDVHFASKHFTSSGTVYCATEVHQRATPTFFVGAFIFDGRFDFGQGSNGIVLPQFGVGSSG